MSLTECYQVSERYVHRKRERRRRNHVISPSNPDYWQFSLHFPLDFISRLMPPPLHEENVFFLPFWLFIFSPWRGKNTNGWDERREKPPRPRLLCFASSSIPHNTGIKMLRCRWSVSKRCCVLGTGVDMESARGLLYLMSAICIRWKISSSLTPHACVWLFYACNEQHSTSVAGEEGNLFIFYERAVGNSQV